MLYIVKEITAEGNYILKDIDKLDTEPLYFASAGEFHDLAMKGKILYHNDQIETILSYRKVEFDKLNEYYSAYIDNELFLTDVFKEYAVQNESIEDDYSHLLYSVIVYNGITINDLYETLSEAGFANFDLYCYKNRMNDNRYYLRLALPESLINELRDYIKNYSNKDIARYARMYNTLKQTNCFCFCGLVLKVEYNKLETLETKKKSMKFIISVTDNKQEYIVGDFHDDSYNAKWSQGAYKSACLMENAIHEDGRLLDRTRSYSVIQSLMDLYYVKQGVLKGTAALSVIENKIPSWISCCNSEELKVIYYRIRDSIAREVLASRMTEIGFVNFEVLTYTGSAHYIRIELPPMYSRKLQVFIDSFDIDTYRKKLSDDYYRTIPFTYGGLSLLLDENFIISHKTPLVKGVIDNAICYFREHEKNHSTRH